MDFLIDNLKFFAEINEAGAWIGWKYLVMYAAGIILIYLAIKKNYEPALLLPVGFGAILINLPLTDFIVQIMPGVEQIYSRLYETGIEASQLLPLLLFLCIGLMIDFGPLLSRPYYFLFGAAANFGVFFIIAVSVLLGFKMNDAAAIGIAGTLDGPMTVFAANMLKTGNTASVLITAFLFMALVPVIQPPVIRFLTTRKERIIHMPPFADKDVPKTVKIIFPIFVTFFIGIISPSIVLLIGFFMLGNLIRECTVFASLSDAAKKTLVKFITILLGITVAFTLNADNVIRKETLMILGLGFIAFIINTACGVLLGKLLNIFLKNKINPMIGAAGISVFPNSAHVIQKMALKEDPKNYLLMHAVSVNVSGQIASIAACGLVFSLVISYLAV